MENHCGEMLRNALSITRKEIRELSALDARERAQLFRKIEADSETYERECGLLIDQQVRDNDLAGFRLAELKLAYSLQRDGNGDSENQVTSSIVKRFSGDEYAAFGIFDKFSQIDFMKATEITTALVNKDDQIYRIVKEWYVEQMDTFLDLLETNTGREIGGMVAVAMRDRYNMRFQKIRDSVIAYLRQDPGQLRKLFTNYEEMITKMTGLEKSRAQVELDLREILSGEEVDSIFDEFQTLSTFVERRELSKIASMDVDHLKGKVRDIIRKIEDKKLELERERDRLENDPEMRLNSELKENEKGRMNETINRAYSYIHRLNDEVVGGIDDLKDISVAMGNAKDEGRIPDDQGVTADEAVLRKTQFMEDSRRVFEASAPFVLTDPITGKQGRVKLRRNRPKENIWFFNEDSIGDSDGQPRLKEYEMDHPFEGHRGFFRSNINFSLKTAVLMHETLYEGHRMDLYQVGIADFAVFYSRLLNRMDDEGAPFTYVLVGSPNGFTQKLIDQVTGEGVASPLRGRSLCVVLKDLRNGTLFYDSKNRESKQFVELFSQPGSKTDKIEFIKVKTAETGKKWHGVVRLASVQSETGASETDIMQAWKEMEKEKRGKVSKIEGETVFEMK